MNAIDKMMQTPTFLGLSKRERLQVQRQRAKLEKNLGSISELNRLPSAIFVVDINKEHIAVHEARRLNIPIFAIVDTNTDPTIVDFPIPANDDAAESISIIVNNVAEAIKEGLEERRFEKEKNKQEGNDSKSKEPKTVKVASSKKEAISKEEKKEEPKKDNAE
jgi:small subunit ribosomal protein S2